jgi:hypothetical protein
VTARPYRFSLGTYVLSCARGTAPAFHGVIESRSVDAEGSEGYVVRDWLRKRWFRDAGDLSAAEEQPR